MCLYQPHQTQQQDFLIFTNEEAVVDTNLTVEEAFKALFSGGVLAPKDIITSFNTADIQTSI